MVVQLHKHIYEAMIEQAKKEFPLECCGLISGEKTEQGLRIEQHYPLYNTDQSSEHFSMDPKEQFAVIKAIRNEQKLLLGNYHSHPYTPSRPSEEDKKLAYDEAMIYGIISLADHKPVLNFFKIRGQKEVEKLVLEIL